MSVLGKQSAAPVSPMWADVVLNVDSRIRSDGEHPWDSDVSFPLRVQFLSAGPSGTRMNWHHYLEVVVVHAGDAMCQVKERTFPVRTGELLCLGSRVHHRIWAGPGSTVRMIALSFLPHLLQPDDESSECFEFLTPFHAQLHVEGFPHVVSAASGLPNEIESWMRRIHDCLPADTTRKRLCAKTYLRMILVLLLNHYAEIEASREGVRVHIANIRRLQPLFEFIDENYDQKITASTAAVLLNMSRSSFLRQFKRLCGQSFQSYLVEFRLEKAMLLLSSNRLSMKEVALSAGFCDQSYFGLVFRRFTGHTPGSYRACMEKLK